MCFSTNILFEFIKHSPDAKNRLFAFICCFFEKITEHLSTLRVGIKNQLYFFSGVNLNTEKLSNLPSKDKVVTSEDLIKKFQEEAQISKIHEEFERNELENKVFS